MRVAELRQNIHALVEGSGSTRVAQKNVGQNVVGHHIKPNESVIWADAPERSVDSVVARVFQPIGLVKHPFDVFGFAVIHSPAGQGGSEHCPLGSVEAGGLPNFFGHSGLSGLPRGHLSTRPWRWRGEHHFAEHAPKDFVKRIPGQSNSADGDNVGAKLSFGIALMKPELLGL